MTVRNADIRSIIRKLGLTQWLVAEKMGISEATFTRWLRKELSDEERKQIFNAIEELRGEVTTQ